MLSEISIENVAVIEKASVSFVPGFNVLTGETGAGKSIVIDSINAILGNRTSRDIVRSGAKKAAVWAQFQGVPAKLCASMEEAGYSVEEELILQREISSEGKSNCRINGNPATAATLKQICSDLVQIHGQHDNQNLMDPARHLYVLDAFAQNNDLMGQYKIAYQRMTALQKEIEALNMDEAEKARKIDLLSFEVEEIEGAGLLPGEEVQLEERREMIRNSQNIVDALQSSLGTLNGDDEQPGAASQLGFVFNQLSAAASFSSELASFSERAGELYYATGELASEIGHGLESYDFDAAALDEVESRLDILYRLKKKYGPTVEDVLTYGGKARRELDDISFSEERLAVLSDEREKVAGETQSLAEKLSDTRIKAFERFKKEVAGALDFLNMPDITLDLHHNTVPAGFKGQDELEFYISTNPGEAPKPLAKIASGGELARIMLAIKSALAERDELATIIYDEIDTGISGLAAGRIGRMLRDTAAGGRQVICVTHTAQIAAYAACHLRIEKTVREGRTYTEIRELSDEERVEELARIVSGDHVTDTALANAREMLETARTGA